MEQHDGAPIRTLRRQLHIGHLDRLALHHFAGTGGPETDSRTPQAAVRSCAPEPRGFPTLSWAAVGIAFPVSGLMATGLSAVCAAYAAGAIERPARRARNRRRTICLRSGGGTLHDINHGSGLDIHRSDLGPIVFVAVNSTSAMSRSTVPADTESTKSTLVATNTDRGPRWTVITSSTRNHLGDARSIAARIAATSSGEARSAEHDQQAPWIRVPAGSRPPPARSRSGSMRRPSQRPSLVAWLREYPSARDQQTSERRRILEQHDEGGRVLRAADRLPPALLALGTAEAANGSQPACALEQEGGRPGTI